MKKLEKLVIVVGSDVHVVVDKFMLPKDYAVLRYEEDNISAAWFAEDGDVSVFPILAHDHSTGFVGMPVIDRKPR